MRQIWVGLAIMRSAVVRCGPNQVGFQQASTQVIAIGFCVKDLSQAIGAE